MTERASPAALSPASISYSRSFEAFVGGETDLPGLLAYALYKQALRERTINGLPTPKGAERHPTRTEIDTYRGAADRRLQTFALSAIEETRPEIERAFIGAAITDAKKDIIRSIENGTSFWWGVTVNIVGWVSALGLTLLILNASKVPELYRVILGWLS